ncbi:lysophospholipid acyltransferase family protein [Paenibacillus sp. TRM 82003]|nr:lysophospholipid acyltransferase family protein [Paenibacillus sp. TRM 82003]
MIEARKSKLFEAAFDRYNRWLLRRFFHNIYCRVESNDEPPPEPIVASSTLYAANHGSWWDGLIAFHLNRVLLREDVYVMMSRDGLERFRFFRRLGAFSIDRDSPADVRRSLRYALRLLTEPRPPTPSAAPAALWLFPQGDIRHQDVRPLGFRPGLAFLLRGLTDANANSQVVPVAFTYSFGLDQKPDVYVTVGRPCPPDASPNDVEEALTALLDAQREEVKTGSPERYVSILRGRPSTSDVFLQTFRRGASAD